MDGLSTRLRIVKKWNRTPGARPPAHPPEVFFLSKSVIFWKIWTGCVRMVNKWNRNPGARPPARPPGFCFRQKQRSKNQTMRMYEKNVHLCVFFKKADIL